MQNNLQNYAKNFASLQGMVKIIFEEGKYQIKTSRTRSSAWYQGYFNHNRKD